MTYNIGLVGAAGKMGQEIFALLKESSLFHLKAGIDIKPVSGFENHYSQIEDVPEGDLQIIIDFSQHFLFDRVCNWCIKNKVSLVSGTTGISPEQVLQLEMVGHNVPVLWSPNMSLGIAILKEMLKPLKYLKDFDFQMEEIHHNQKKDKPSGTAIMLHKHLGDVLQKKIEEPFALRGGGVFGTHKIFALGQEEVITIEHAALNRRVFARGAVKAAEWLVFQKAGHYTMKDFLSL